MNESPFPDNVEGGTDRTPEAREKQDERTPVQDETIASQADNGATFDGNEAHAEVKETKVLTKPTEPFGAHGEVKYAPTFEDPNED